MVWDRGEWAPEPLDYREQEIDGPDLVEQPTADDLVPDKPRPNGQAAPRDLL